MKAVRDPKRFADNATRNAQKKIYSAINLLRCIAMAGRAADEERTEEALDNLCEAVDGIQFLLDDTYMDIENVREQLEGLTNATA